MCSCHEQIFSDANGRLTVDKDVGKGRGHGTRDKGQHFHLRTILSRDKRNLDAADGGWTDTDIVYVSKFASKCAWDVGRGT